MKLGANAGRKSMNSPDVRCDYQNYMFNPSIYSKSEIEMLRAPCQRPVAAPSGCRLREGTSEEWRVISGLAEGSTVNRRLPDFVKSVLDFKERL